jgi:RNA polymerase sigma-70 factor (ECF subfamily)
LTDWQQIIRDHGPMAFDTAWRVVGNAPDAEDAVQEAFADAVRVARGTRVHNIGGLLRRLTARRAVDLLRRRHGTSDLPANHPASASTRPEAIAVGAELATRLRAAVAQLPYREAEVFAMRYFAAVPNADIAMSLGMTPGAVGVALHKARARLEELLNLNEDRP